DPVRRSELAPERVELLPQLGVPVTPGVTRQPAVPGRALGLRRPVAERRGDDAPRTFEQPLGVARELGLRHREAHPAEQAPRAALADVTLGGVVTLGARDADRVEAERFPQAPHLSGRHRRIVPAGQAEMMAACRLPTWTRSSAQRRSAASSGASYGAARRSQPRSA